MGTASQHINAGRRGDRKTFRWYIDFALSVIGGMCFLFGVVATQEIHASDSSVIDGKIAVCCFVLMSFCVIAARRRLSVLVSSIALPSAFLFLRFWSSGDVKALQWAIAFQVVSYAVLAGAALITYFQDR